LKSVSRTSTRISTSVEDLWH